MFIPELGSAIVGDGGRDVDIDDEVSSRLVADWGDGSLGVFGPRDSGVGLDRGLEMMAWIVWGAPASAAAWWFVRM